MVYAHRQSSHFGKKMEKKKKKRGMVRVLNPLPVSLVSHCCADGADAEWLETPKKHPHSG